MALLPFILIRLSRRSYLHAVYESRFCVSLYDNKTHQGGIFLHHEKDFPNKSFPSRDRLLQTYEKPRPAFRTG